MAIHRDWEAISRDFLMEHAARGDARAAEILRGLLLERPEEAPVGPAGGPATRIAVGVCTARRPLMLAHCLKAIGAQIVGAGIEAHVVVADNEPRPTSRRLVQDFAARCPFSVHYVHQPQRGIPQARNAVLDACRDLGADWIAFTDDDCWASPLWLTDLLEAASRHEADVVYGRREFLLPEPAQFWASPADPSAYTEGQRLPFAATHNVLTAARLIGPKAAGDAAEGAARSPDGDGGMRFDETLSHGEDTDFFFRLARRGARIVYAHAPVVYETVTPERATLAYQAKRSYHYAASRSSFHRRYKGLGSAFQKAAARWLFQAPMALARLLAAFLVLPFSEPAFRSLVLKGTARLAGAAGAAAGLVGCEGNPYRTIDGY